jgi:hypothetical protein
MRQRDECRLEAALVTGRQVHVTKLCERVRHTAAGADGDECAVAAFLPGREPFEFFTRRLANRVAAIVDVAG